MTASLRTVLKTVFFVVTTGASAGAGPTSCQPRRPAVAPAHHSVEPKPLGTRAASAPIVPSEEANLPLLKIDAKGITLDGQFLAPPVEARLKRIDELTAPLRQRLAQGSNLPTPRTYRLEVSTDSNIATLKSAFQSAAFSGWPCARLQTISGDVLLTARIPKPVEDADGCSLAATDAASVLVLRPDETELWMSASVVEQHLPPSARSGGLGITEEADGRDPRVRVSSTSTETTPAKASTWLQTYCNERAPCPQVAVSLDSSLSVAHWLMWVGVFAEACQRSAAVPCELGLRVSPPPEKGAPPDLGYKSMRVGSTTVSGRLPPEVIRATVRANYDRLRKCYEQGLAKEPQLTGKVVVRFVIGRDGKVANALLDEASTLPNAEVKECVRATFPTITFPPPDGGIVTVVYPVSFEPG